MLTLNLGCLTGGALILHDVSECARGVPQSVWPSQAGRDRERARVRLGFMCKSDHNHMPECCSFMLRGSFNVLLHALAHWVFHSRSLPGNDLNWTEQAVKLLEGVDDEHHRKAQLPPVCDVFSKGPFITCPMVERWKTPRRCVVRSRKRG